uniref:TSA: Wollemia nobilis Ref_Wollemi_Transcript_18698_772 transcribed RNA sequence n=1 Tax=Wollemia nobilis TaxID=56998 RepID=A0A0C9S5Q1_9CONI
MAMSMSSSSIRFVIPTTAAIRTTHAHAPSCLPLPSGGVDARRSSLSSSSSSLFTRGVMGRDATNIRKIARRRTSSSVKVKALFGLGVPELVVIAGVTALIFGPKKLPEIGKSLGKTVKSFQQAAKEFETEVKKESEPPTTESQKTFSSEGTAETDEKNVQI